MSKKDIPAKMLALQLKDPNLLYNCYTPFLEHGGLFVPTDDVSSPGEDTFLAAEIADYSKRLLPTRVVWINPARTSAHCPKSVGLVFSEHESCQQVKNLIEAELGPCLRSDRITFTL